MHAFIFLILIICSCNNKETNENDNNKNKESSFARNGISLILDFIPGISTVKGIYEATVGEDPVTKEKLSSTDRGLSTLSIIPFGKLLANTKKLKNGLKFSKASKRAVKPKNIKSFSKAAERAFKNAYKVGNYISKSFKAIKNMNKKKKNDEKKNNDL